MNYIFSMSWHILEPAIGDKKVQTFVLKRVTSEDKRIHTPPLSPPFKVECLLFCIGWNVLCKIDADKFMKSRKESRKHYNIQRTRASSNNNKLQSLTEFSSYLRLCSLSELLAGSKPSRKHWNSSWSFIFDLNWFRLLLTFFYWTQFWPNIPTKLVKNIDMVAHFERAQMVAHSKHFG